MQEYTEEQILEKYLSLPQELKTAMASVKSSSIIMALGKKYGLNIEQTGELASETGYVLMGLTRPENFIRNLGERLEVDLQKAKAIALDVNAQIFSQVKESLKKIHGIGREKTENSTPQKQGAENATPATEKSVQKTEPLELTKKHEAEKPAEIPRVIQSPIINPASALKPNYFEALKQKISAEEIINPAQNTVETPLSEKIDPDRNDISGVAKDEISRYAKQTTEIMLPEKKEENKNIIPQTEQYPKGDPYREPV